MRTPAHRACTQNGVNRTSLSIPHKCLLPPDYATGVRITGVSLVVALRSLLWGAPGQGSRDPGTQRNVEIRTPTQWCILCPGLKTCLEVIVYRARRRPLPPRKHTIASRVRLRRRIVFSHRSSDHPAAVAKLNFHVHRARWWGIRIPTARVTVRATKDYGSVSRHRRSRIPWCVVNTRSARPTAVRGFTRYKYLPANMNLIGFKAYGKALFYRVQGTIRILKLWRDAATSNQLKAS